MKNLVLFLAALLFASPLFAQRGLQLGVRIAPQMTYYNNADDNDEGPSLDIVFPSGGVQGGLSVDYHFSDNVGVGLNFLYSGQSAKYEGVTEVAGVTLATFERTAKFGYFKIPLLFTFNTNPDGGSMLLVSTGPQLSFLTGAKFESTTTPTGGSAQTFTESDFQRLNNFKFQETFSSSTFDWVFNIGARFKVADNMYIDAGFRFDYTLTDPEDKDFTIPNTNVKYWQTEQNNGTLKPRAKSSWITGGLNLGFTYVLPN
jgi:opacity protein-like surface antigen